SAVEAAAMFAASPQYAREVIHTFGDKGFAALDASGQMFCRFRGSAGLSLAPDAGHVDIDPVERTRR
ncbi:MAG TPA: hypothetical protein VGD71_43240, partial [Kribbella sp.]